MSLNKLKVPFALIFLGCIIGVIFSGVLIYEHNGAKTQIGAAVCDVNETSSCDKAKDSSLGKPFGVPLALFGFIYYGGLLALALLLLIALHDSAMRLLFWSAVTGFAFDIFLLLYSITLLGGICRLCAITYVASAIIVAGVFLLNRQGASMIKSDTIPMKAKVGFSTVLLATVVAGIFFHNSALNSQSAVAAGKTAQERKLVEQLNNEFYKQWRAGELLNLDRPSSGNKGSAKPILTIMEFADPLCPHCKDMGVVLDNFVKAHSDTVKIIFRHYPLDVQCNDAMKRAFHVGSCDLSRTIECGEAQGKFWQMHDAVFADQEVFFRSPVTPRSIETLAQSAGLNAASLTACFKNQATMAKVKADIAAGNRIKITGTPTTIVNDRRLPGAPLEYVPGILEKILQEESRH